MRLSLIEGALGGIGLFLLGMRFMSEGIRKLADDRIRRLLSMVTANRFSSLLFGAFMSFSLQSGSAAILFTVGLANGGVLSAFQSLGVLSGVMLGASLTLQLHFIDYGFIGAPLVFMGVTLRYFARRRRLSYAGDLLIGIGLLFLGFKLLETSFKPLGSHPLYELFRDGIRDSGIIAMSLGMLLSCLIQSVLSLSSVIAGLATAYNLPTSIIFQMVGGGFLGMALIGLLAAVGGTRMTRRVMVCYALLHLVLLMVMLALMPLSVKAVLYLSGMFATQHVEADVDKYHAMIAWFHTLLSAVLGLLTAISSGQIARYLGVQDSGLAVGYGGSQPSASYLDHRILNTPPIAIEQARKEIVRMASIVSNMFGDVRELLFDFDARRVQTARQHEQVLDALNHEITAFMAALAGKAVSPEINYEIPGLLQTVTDLEHIGDRCDDLLDYLLAKKESGVTFSSAAMDDLKKLAGQVGKFVTLVAETVHDGQRSAIDVRPLKNEFRMLLDTAKKYHFERIGTGVCPPRSAMLFNDMLSAYERIADLCWNILEARGRREL